MPATKVRVYLKSRNASIGSLPPPPVHAAGLRIKLRLGERVLVSAACCCLPRTGRGAAHPCTLLAARPGEQHCPAVEAEFG